MQALTKELRQKRLYHTEKFYLAEMGFSFFFERTEVKRVGSLLSLLQHQYMTGGAPVINQDAYLQVEGQRPLGAGFNIYNFGSLGGINRHVSGLRMVVLHLDHTYYQCQIHARTSAEFRQRSVEIAQRGAYRLITSDDYRIMFRGNRLVKSALKLRIPLPFNSLERETNSFRREALKVIRKLFLKPTGNSLETFELPIYHADSSVAQNDFWKSNFLADPSYMAFSRKRSPYAFYVHKETERVAALIRNPSHDTIDDPAFLPVTLDIAYASLRHRINGLYDLAVEKQGALATRSPKHWKKVELLNLIADFSKAGRLLDRYESIPLLVGLPTDAFDSDFANERGVGFLRWLCSDSLAKLKFAKPMQLAVLQVANQFQKHLGIVATDQLNSLIVVLTVAGVLVGLLDAFSNVYAAEIKNVIELLLSPCLPSCHR